MHPWFLAEYTAGDHSCVMMAPPSWHHLWNTKALWGFIFLCVLSADRPSGLKAVLPLMPGWKRETWDWLCTWDFFIVNPNVAQWIPDVRWRVSPPPRQTTCLFMYLSCVVEEINIMLLFLFWFLQGRMFFSGKSLIFQSCVADLWTAPLHYTLQFTGTFSCWGMRLIIFT